MHCVSNSLLSRPFDLILLMCTQLTPFKTIWPTFINVYSIDFFQDHMTRVLHCVPTFINVYPIDYFQDHMTWFLHCVPNWLLLRPFDLILSMFTQLTPFKTTWPDFYIVYPTFISVYPINSFQDHMTSFLYCVSNWLFKIIWPNFINVYPIDSLQNHLTWFLHCVPNWLLSRPFDLILSMCIQLTPFKTIWPDFYIVYPIYPIVSFQDYMTWFLHCVPNLSSWLLWRSFDLIFGFCTKLTPFKTIWPDFCIVYLIDSFQDHITWFLHLYPNYSFEEHLTWFYHCVPNWLLWRPSDLILSLCTQLTILNIILPYFCIVYPIHSFQYHLT